MQNKNVPECKCPGKKYNYKTRKERVILKIVDGKQVKGDKEVPIYDGLSYTDPLGSYTGVPNDPNQVPVQDVDDL